MRHLFRILLPALALISLYLPLGGCTCGFDCSSDDDNADGPAILSLGVSDALPEELKQVVIEIDRITLRPANGDDITIDRFTIDKLDIVDEDSFQMDLLDYRGLNQLLAFESLEIDAQFYSEIRIKLIADDVNHSFVQEDDDELKEITLFGDELVLDGMQIDSGEQNFTIEFGLARSLRYLAATDQYALTTEGVRVENSDLAAALSGRVDEDLFDTVSPCDEKDEPVTGNRVYLYSGKDLDTKNLADVFTDDSQASAPSSAIAPFAVAYLRLSDTSGSWEYFFGYLPTGDYTIAFSCDTEEDDSIEYDGLTISLPDTQVYEISLSETERAQCNLVDEDSPACE